MQLTDCFVEIGCVTDCIGGRAFSEGCQHSENCIGCTNVLCHWIEQLDHREYNNILPQPLHGLSEIVFLSITVQKSTLV